MDDKEYVQPRGLLKKTMPITPVQLIVLSYLALALLGAILLSLPISLKPGVSISFMDALFTSTSAISVTGLSVVTVHQTYSSFGLAILLLWLQLGGIGIMTLGTLMYVVLGRQINLRGRMLIKVDQNQSSLEGMVILMLFIFKLALLLELFAALLLTGHFFINYNLDLKSAFLMGVFHAISAFTNAGFDLFGNSLQGFPHDYFIHTVITVLLVLGAIGFPVLMEVRSRLRRKIKHFSLFTKVAVITYGGLLILGFIIILFGEGYTSLVGVPWHQKLSVALFQSASTRSGGFTTFDITQFGSATLLFLCLLMFIGGSPSSCGGGIRTTTFAVIILSIFTLWRGRDHVQLFGRELYPQDINRAYSIFAVAIMLVFFSTMAILYLEPFDVVPVLFEVCSAFGTCGMSMGITADLGTISKAILIVLMFIGRVGLLALLLLRHRPGKKEKFHYVKERIIVG